MDADGAPIPQDPRGTGTGAPPPTSGDDRAAGGAGMAEEGAPIGVTADVGGEPETTDDPATAAEAAGSEAAAHTQPKDSERAEGDT